MSSTAPPDIESRVSNYADVFCGYCGARLPLTTTNLASCPQCSTLFRDASPTAWSRSERIPLPVRARTGSKDPTTATILAAILPGAGQVYNGQFFKGLFVFLTCWLVIPWLFGVLDAYINAKRSMPTGEVAFAPAADVISERR